MSFPHDHRRRAKKKKRWNRIWPRGASALIQYPPAGSSGSPGPAKYYMVRTFLGLWCRRSAVYALFCTRKALYLSLSFPSSSSIRQIQLLPSDAIGKRRARKYSLCLTTFFHPPFFPSCKTLLSSFLCWLADWAYTSMNVSLFWLRVRKWMCFLGRALPGEVRHQARRHSRSIWKRDISATVRRRTALPWCSFKSHHRLVLEQSMVAPSNGIFRALSSSFYNGQHVRSTKRIMARAALIGVISQ